VRRVDEDVRELFQRELPGLPEPPLGPLVRDSIRQGRRIRAVRRICAATVLAAGTAVIVLVAVPLAAVPTADVRPPAQALAGTDGTPPAGGGDEDVAASSPVGRTAATPEGLLEVLLQGLPDGRTSHYAKSSRGLHVQAFLHDARSNPGMVRIKVLGRPDLLPAQMSTDPQSWTLPSGNTATVVGLPEDCTRSLHVEVSRPSGVVVAVDVGSCLAWSGFRLGRGRLALTQEQAVEIADDPRLSGRMSKDLITRGAKRAGELATFDEDGS
jgi:hypothetical protein